MIQFRISDRARTDLDDLWTYIAHDNPEVADKFIDRIMTHIKLLARNPEMGQVRSELAAGLRSFPVKSYIVFYRPAQRSIEIVRILHGARNLADYF